MVPLTSACLREDLIDDGRDGTATCCRNVCLPKESLREKFKEISIMTITCQSIYENLMVDPIDQGRDGAATWCHSVCLPEVDLVEERDYAATWCLDIEVLGRSSIAAVAKAGKALRGSASS